MRTWLMIAAVSTMAGCASSSSEIKGTYVSPIQYQNLTCQQVGQEMERVSRRASEASGVQDSQKSQDGWVTAGAIILFWPAAFFIKGDGQNAAELARLKGEFEALERVGIEKNCNMQVRRG